MKASVLRRSLTLALLLAPLLPPLAQAQTPAPGPVLTVSGTRGLTRDYTMAALEAMPQVEVRTSNPWSKTAVSYSGPLLRTVLEATGADGQTVRAVALNDYRVALPTADVREHNVILATRANGQPLSVRDKGPLFVVYPFDAEPALKQQLYYERSIWQVRRLQVE